jgi:hypothetical protein
MSVAQGFFGEGEAEVNQTHKTVVQLVAVPRMSELWHCLSASVVASLYGVVLDVTSATCMHGVFKLTNIITAVAQLMIFCSIAYTPEPHALLSARC